MPIPEAEVYEATCVICGTVFTAERRYKNHEGRSTCSLACMGKFSHLRRSGESPAILEQEADCQECGAHFIARRKTPKLGFPVNCSRSCANKENGRQRRDTSWVREQEQQCVVCGKAFLAKRRKSTDAFRSICSLECHAKLRESKLKRQCRHCGGIFWQQRSVVKRGKNGGCFCSQECYHAFTPQNGSGLVSGRKMDKGYVLLYAPDHPATKRKYVYEHRLVMEKLLGRYLMPHENVHHIDGDRANNAPENLELWVSPQPSGQRAHQLYKQDVERLARENYVLKQRIAELEASQ